MVPSVISSCEPVLRISVSFSGNFLAVITFTDITEKIERKEFIALAQADEKRREALEKAIQMKDEFLMLISHEFKTPLTIISSSVQAMEQICKNELSDKAKNFINKIKKGTNRQLKLINNLLDITKIKNDSLSIKNQNIEIVLLTRSIVEFIRIYAEQKNITLSFRTRLKNKIIGIDVNKYERILLNLLSNAIKYTPKGKSIKVTLSQKNLYGNKKIQLSVVDSGIGIPADKVKTIFEKFGQVDGPLTRQAEGTGIGLYLVKILVEKMNGHITVDSKEGIGSSFNVYLPADKTKDHLIKEKIEELTEDRLAHAVAIEFSDIFI